MGKMRLEPNPLEADLQSQCPNRWIFRKDKIRGPDGDQRSTVHQHPSDVRSHSHFETRIFLEQSTRIPKRLQAVPPLQDTLEGGGGEGILRLSVACKASWRQGRFSFRFQLEKWCFTRPVDKSKCNTSVGTPTFHFERPVAELIVTMENMVKLCPAIKIIPESTWLREGMRGPTDASKHLHISLCRRLEGPPFARCSLPPTPCGDMPVSAPLS